VGVHASTATYVRGFVVSWMHSGVVICACFTTTTVLVSPSINRSSDFVLDPNRLAAIRRRRTRSSQPERSATGGTHLGRAAAADEGRRG
jgi:hypothetical protein